jgi:class 3 adenylate cyclase
VTALFCDLVGFTPLSEALDPEEVREIQTHYFAQMNGELHRFGGSVEKYAGDAVLALFGAPVAHEDDAERAVRCALAMQQAFRPVAERAKREWNVDLAVRIGVNTGEAISGAWDVEGRRDYSATGDVVNTAARLQSAADPGGVIVGPETMHLARRAVVFGPRRDLTLKGKATAFPAYPVVQLREQVAERWETAEQRAPLIGRDRELASLMDIWRRAQTGEGRLVTLIGDAGVGKSRLLSAAVERMTLVMGTVVVRGRCASYGEGMSLHLVAALIRSMCQLHEDAAPDQIRASVRTTVDALLAPWDEETRDAAADVVGTVLGLPPAPSAVAHASPQVRRQTLIRSLQLLLGALSTYRPAIVVLEDLHWIDGETQALLDSLV